jgi:uncharacterized protein (TIGR04255 family)
MANIRPLARAPVFEALIDLRVQAPEGMSVERLEKALEERSFGYHKKGPVVRGNFGVFINAEETPSGPQMQGSTTIVGVRTHSSDDRYVAQFTLEGFTLSRLWPYESWEALVAETKRVWSIYVACVAPVRINRVATRYINNLQLPVKPGERFRRYLTGLPDMPSDYPQTISSFFQRFVVYDEKCGATAILTQALEQVTEATPLPVILDIDVFRETKFPVGSPVVWQYLAELRDLKNRCFFGALTEEAVELYE